MGCALLEMMDVTFFWTCNILSVFCYICCNKKRENKMSLVSKKDFAEALNVPYGTIRSKFTRKQLCCNRKGLVDTENVKNYQYILEINGGDQSVFEQYHVGSNSKTNVNKKNTSQTKSEEKFTENKEKPVKSRASLSSKIEEKPQKPTNEEKKLAQERKIITDALAQFELRKKEAEVSLVERNAQLKQWELEKKAGNTLPLDMIESVITVNYKAVFKSIHSQIKNIAMVMVQQLGGSKEDLNSIMIELENILEKTVGDSKKKAEVDIEKLINEFSEIRSRGERR